MFFVFSFFFFFFNDTATTEIYTLSLHDALPILRGNGDSLVDRLLELDGQPSGRGASQPPRRRPSANPTAQPPGQPRGSRRRAEGGAGRAARTNASVATTVGSCLPRSFGTEPRLRHPSVGSAGAGSGAPRVDGCGLQRAAGDAPALQHVGILARAHDALQRVTHDLAQLGLVLRYGDPVRAWLVLGAGRQLVVRAGALVGRHVDGRRVVAEDSDGTAGAQLDERVGVVAVGPDGDLLPPSQPFWVRRSRSTWVVCSSTATTLPQRSFSALMPCGLPRWTMMEVPAWK